MNDLKAFSDWLLDCSTLIGNTVFTKWGILGTACFCIPILRKLVKIFRDTF